MLGQHPLDLDRVHVLAAGDDHVLEPVLDEDVAAVVDPADVAGAEPAVLGDRLRGRLRLVVVALHQLRCAEPQFALLAAGDVLQRVRDRRRAPRRWAPASPRWTAAPRCRSDGPPGIRWLITPHNSVSPYAWMKSVFGQASSAARSSGSGIGDGAVGVGLERAEQLDRVLAGLQHLGQHRGHQEGPVGALQDRAGQRGAVDVARHHARDAVVDARAARTTSRRRGTAASPPCSCRRRRTRSPRGALTVCAMRLACVSATPLGRPVVPDEYMMMQTSSGSTSADAAHGRRRRQHRLVLVAVASVGRDLDDVLDVRQLVADLVDRRLELRPDDQHLGAGIVEHVVHLVGGEPEVDDRVGRPQRCGGERRLQARRVVLVEERDDVAAPDAAFGQRAGQPADPVVPLRPRPGPVQVGDGFVVGLGLGPVSECVRRGSGDQAGQT